LIKGLQKEKAKALFSLGLGADTEETLSFRSSEETVAKSDASKEALGE
jgi:hypothetical protein